MIGRLQDGDIVITLAHAKTLKELESSTADAFHTLSDLAIHAMIYHQGKFYHSSSGKNQAGVKAHLVANAIKLDVDNFMKYAVVRIQDDALQQLLADTVVRWNIILTDEELKTRPKDLLGRIRLATPFQFAQDRRIDQTEVTWEHELFRAVRAYARNHENPPLPLSKEKGVACSAFVAYALKSAMLEQLFPKGLPDAIVQKFQEIIDVKKEKKSTKLDQIAEAKFREFSIILLDELSKVTFPPMLKLTYFNFLSAQVKGYDVTSLCDNLQKMPNLFMFAGYLFLQKTEDSLIPFIMNHDRSVELMQNIEKESLPIILPDLSNLKIQSPKFRRH